MNTCSVPVHYVTNTLWSLYVPLSISLQSVPLLPADLCAQRRRDAANMCALALYVRACGMLEAAFHAADALLGSREERKEGEGNGWDAEPLSLCGKSLKDVKAWLHLYVREDLTVFLHCHNNVDELERHRIT